MLTLNILHKAASFVKYHLQYTPIPLEVWEVKEVRMRKMGQPVSRQTIANYTYRLEAQNLINRHTDNYIYYFAYKQEQRFVERDEYLQAWYEYWTVHRGAFQCRGVWQSLAGDDGSLTGWHQTRTWKFWR